MSPQSLAYQNERKTAIRAPNGEEWKKKKEKIAARIRIAKAQEQLEDPSTSPPYDLLIISFPRQSKTFSIKKAGPLVFCDAKETNRSPTCTCMYRKLLLREVRHPGQAIPALLDMAADIVSSPASDFLENLSRCQVRRWVFT